MIPAVNKGLIFTVCVFTLASMNNIILDDNQYTDMPLEVDEAFERSVEISADFLPSPEEFSAKTVVGLNCNEDAWKPLPSPRKYDINPLGIHLHRGFLN